MYLSPFRAAGPLSNEEIASLYLAGEVSIDEVREVYADMAPEFLELASEVAILRLRTARADERDRIVALVEGLAVADGEAERSAEQCHAGRTEITEATVIDDVALLERVARRLRRFMRVLVSQTIKIAPQPEPPTIDDPTRAFARRLLARSGFVQGRS